MPDGAPNSEPAPPAGDVDALRRVCPVLLPTDDGYDAARDAWNKDIIGKPALIVRPKDAAEVAEVVKWAVAANQTMCIASGRHSIYASRTGCLMLDLSRLTQLDVDPEKRTVDVGPGIKLGAFDAACAAHGLATTAGTNPDTGVAGLTLGGGFGFLCRRHGLSIDNLLECEVVLVDGRIVVASADSKEFSDLFWALRGGGGNFGVVTRFKFKLYPRGPVLIHMAVHFRTSLFGLLPGAQTVARRFRDKTSSPSLPRDTLPFLVLPAGGPVISFFPWVGDDLAAGRKYISEEFNLGTAVYRTTGEAAYGTGKGCLQAYFADQQGPGWYYDCSLVIGDATDEFLDELLACTATAPKGCIEAVAMILPLGGAINDVDPTSTSFGHRGGKYWLICLAKWNGPNASVRDNITVWMRDLRTRLKPWVAGSYNTLAALEGSDQIAYGKGPNALRLAEVKAKYDGANFLRMNNNIVPKGMEVKE
ncbi:hypothetical protein DFJ74DRAFT_772108 [Hyaloraphidium curvatum]|nr:hypothetical protein DFJ74DRAFT_772108 [Hyaloraphidium curvatum]